MHSKALTHRRRPASGSTSGNAGARGRALLPLCALAGVLTGCVPSFRNQPPLAFRDISYSAPDGKPWPEKRIRLPGAQKAFALPEPLEIAFVELNPAGKEPMIFIHGLGSNLKFWRYQLDRFAVAGHRVIALDLPGYGKSDKPASFPYTMESFADVVREVASALAVDHPILVGHSMGGHTALTYAVRWPDEPRALVLTAPAGFEEFSRREKDWFRKVVTVRFIKGAGEYQIWGSVRHANFFHWKPQDEWLIEERVRLAKNPDFEQYAYANVKSIHGLTETDFVRKNLDRIKAPTLIVYGDKDMLIPSAFLHGGQTSDVMEYGHAGIRGSKLTELEGCGHMVQMDCSERYNGAVDGFLSAMKERGAQ